MEKRSWQTFLQQNLHILGAALAILALHFYNNLFTSYGLFRDELYYLACSDRPAFGYVDHPPFSIALLWMSRSLFGDSLFAVRLIPSVAHAGTVVCSGLIARQLGGDRFAQLFASLLTAFAPGIVGITGIYSMNAIDILLWSLIASVLLRMQQAGEPRLWIVIGLLLGIGLMNKLSMAWLAAGLGAGVLLSPLRTSLLTRWPWAAAAIAGFLFLPYVIWNFQNGMAHLEFANNAARIKYASQTPVTFLTGLVALSNPLAVPVWIIGFIALLRHSSREVRILGVCVLTVLMILLINYNSKSEYFTPAVPVLFAAGATVISRWTSQRFRSIANAYCFIVVGTGIMIVPMAIDILSPERLTAYMEAIGVPKQNSEGHRMGALPQHYADRFGWKELADNVGKVYARLAPDEQQLTGIYTQNYGEAAAIDFYGKKFGLPEAMSGHNNYWIWGNERLHDSVDVLIAVGGSAEDYSDTFSEVVLVNTHMAEYAMPYENNLPIYLCRKPRARIRDVWPAVKHYM